MNRQMFITPFPTIPHFLLDLGYKELELGYSDYPLGYKSHMTKIVTKF